jgi:hypothetical protein
MSGCINYNSVYSNSDMSAVALQRPRIEVSK